MPPKNPGKAAPTSQQILAAAERLVQTQGFNGFSYADIAKEIGITTASLHYHFATKAELGQSLIDRYHETFFAALQAIDESSDDAGQKLRRYVELYADVLREKRMCLCGMLAAEFLTLPKPMRESVRRFFDANEQWLAQTLDKGRKAKQLRFEPSPTEVARTILGALEGAMLVARSYGDVARFLATAEWLLSELGAETRARRAP